MKREERREKERVMGLASPLSLAGWGEKGGGEKQADQERKKKHRTPCR